MQAHGGQRLVHTMKHSSLDNEISHNRTQREQRLNETRRRLILDAARSAFLEHGLAGTTLREIAKRAGYTPGAIYTYFSSQEQIYGALLAESLQTLTAAVESAGHSGTHAQTDRRDIARTVRNQALAFYVFYRDHPHDLDLGFYLFNGTRPRGLTPELNRQLNGQLMDALAPVRRGLAALGLSAEESLVETTGIFSHIVGALLLKNTGRIRLFGLEPDELVERYLDGLLLRIR